MPHTLPPVDDDVFEGLQARAVPLVDDVNSVLRRLLELPPIPQNGARAKAADVPLRTAPIVTERVPSSGRKSKKPAKGAIKRTRAPRGSLLPESEYELPLLRFLADSGGRAPASEAVDAVGKVLANRFTPIDKEAIDSGEVRWKSRVQFVRLKLIKTGDMAREAPRGMWAVTDQGRGRAERGD